MLSANVASPSTAAGSSSELEEEIPMGAKNWDALSRQIPTVTEGRVIADNGTIIDRARRMAALDPHRCAIRADGGVQISYAELLADAERLAASLWALGLRPGDVVSFQLPNWQEAAVINLATCLGGWICNPIVPIYRDAELAMMLADCRSQIWFVTGEWRRYDYAAMAERVAANLPDLRAIVRVRDPRPGGLSYESLLEQGAGLTPPAPSLDPDAVKLIMYTSGTTGRAKGVLHSHRSLPAAILRAAEQWGLQQGDRVLMPSPVTHVTGYCCGLEMPFDLGTQTVLTERWDAAEAVAMTLELGVNATVGATPFLQELLAQAEIARSDLPSLRVFACGGAAVPPELVRRANATLAGRVFRVYGMTEAPLITYGISADDDTELAAVTDGRLNGYSVRIEDPQSGEEVPRGAEGEIVVRGDGLFLGYADPAQTAEAVTADDYFRTGDLGVLGDSDAVTITGRKKDLIIRGGENISAKEIEDVLHQHPSIREAAVVSMPHERLGETVCAYLIAREDVRPTLSDICATVLGAGLAKQKCPERLEWVDDFPRTPSGKVRKDILRRMITEAPPGDN
ncbi:cyclohexanecarboxylate-CoA ligase [Sinimarinibacterium sp. CAU 1509]|uniref:AMP-binding protein n=1 Tax=Sinimarinibacterium sp. CAU 1509 TaxID=2562283 RepID=UPI0010AD1A5B|nr:AMP-binding protein [Sinimarinibacterium sp. CAU 1509]TJY59532.1 cyclohexanecarboxylate-CoA ligase [Sinimarinibacterium sp. CAU 1509]